MKPGPHHISIALYDYNLPEDRIAQFPLDQRDQSKILVYRNGGILEDRFFNLAAHLPQDGTLVFNETKVVHARLKFLKSGGSQVEVFCLEPAGPTKDLQVALQEQGTADWLCLVGNSRRWKKGELILERQINADKLSLSATRVEKTGDASVIRFSWSPSNLTFSQILEAAGEVPLPPYIVRQATGIDEDHYQTVYARHEGSVAAPTAGLHFTGPLLESLKSKGLEVINFTLHVGAGTFKPVIVENIGNHDMHPEQVFLELSKLKQLYQDLDKPLILVGTTSARLMESLYWHGVKLIIGKVPGPYVDIRQWDPYEIGDDPGITRKESLEKVIEVLEKSGALGLAGETRLMIAPGYNFRYPDILITNFHQPRSTLLLLIAAFIGDDWKKAYHFAINNGFRFLSYGDSCVLYHNRY
jgi:S-adenosylmethionine:tRNA ribosyltransferase-isomerase